MSILDDVKNELGKITISKEELENDIKTIRSAYEQIDNARAQVKPELLNEYQGKFEGEARNTLFECLKKIYESLGREAEACESTEKNMKNTLERYKQTESDLVAEMHRLIAELSGGG
jgi:archaellum component FlaC